MIDAKRGADMIETRGRVESLRRNALAVIHRAMNHAKSTGTGVPDVPCLLVEVARAIGIDAVEASLIATDEIVRAAQTRTRP